MSIFNFICKAGALLLFVLLLNVERGYSQINVPAKGHVYDDAEIPRVDIIIDQELLDQILAPGNEESDVEHPATFVFTRGTSIDTVEEVGFRLRGNTSRYSDKKSFKVSFNSFEGGKNYKGFEKLNLNGEHNDPSIIRSKLSWDILNNLGLPAPRANHVDLYINSEYRGLYMNIEQIDENFIDSRFDNNSGNLYKCLWPADLNYLGSDPEEYKFESNGRRAYELKINEHLDDYTNLAKFIDVLNNTSINELPEELEKVFNVSLYLQSLAVEMLAGHWDGYSFLKNNYYLYENPKSGRIEYIHFDMDNTFGIDWIGDNWGTRNLYNWQNQSEYRPLYERLLQVEEYRDRLSYYIDVAIAQEFDLQVLEPRIDALKAMIQASAEADPFRPLDHGFTIEDFNDSYDVALGNHVAYGLKEYISTRTAYALLQLEAYTLFPVIDFSGHQRVFIDQPINFYAGVTHNTTFRVYLNYSLNGGLPSVQEMFDDGNGSDEVAGDGIYSFSMDGLSPPAELEYFIEVIDTDGEFSREPRNSQTLISLEEAEPIPLRINEFMADNDNTITDEAGEYDDWFEVYNDSENSFWIGDYYLSDNFGNPGKWRMPGIFIEPFEYILFWADDDEEQGMFHTNFKLSKDGEELGIFFSEEFGFQPIDTISFGPQAKDISWGRIPDGSGPIEILELATPGRSNLVTGIAEQQFSDFKIWPNPFRSQINISSSRKIEMVQVIDMQGRVLYQSSLPIIKGQLDLQFLTKGYYVLRVVSGQQAGSVRIIRN